MNALVTGHQRCSNKQSVSAVMFAWHLRDNVGVREALPLAMEQLIPDWLSKSTVTGGSFALQSRSTMRAAQLGDDMALMLVRRQRLAADGGSVRYGWSDSSPTAQSD